MENTNLTTEQLLERWRLILEHKNDGVPLVATENAIITYYSNNMAEIKKDGIKFYGVVPEEMYDDDSSIRIKFKFGDNIEEVTYDKNFKED